MSKNTFFIHDYETFGLNPNDKVSQFAGILVDEDFNILEEPHMFYCKVPDDAIPSPMACAITNIKPQDTESGLSEYAFAKRIHDLMNRAGQINAGYNNVNFDDEVSRNIFYRNFLPIYTREFAKGNSRFDFYKLIKAVFAFKEDSIVFPVGEDGKKSLKLENLTKANGIAHESAHDALSDVYATIAIGKLIKEKEPNLYNFVLNKRKKWDVINFIKERKDTLIWYVDNFEKAENNFLSPLLYIGAKEKMSEFYFLDISSNSLSELLSKDVEELKEWKSLSYDERMEIGIERFPIIKVKANKLPVLAPAGTISEETLVKRNFDPKKLRENYNLAKQIVNNNMFVNNTLYEVVDTVFPEQTDPDAKIYSGFPTKQDSAEIENIENKINNFGIKGFAKNFEYNKSIFLDEKYDTLLERMLVRNAKEEVPEEIVSRWNYHCKNLYEGDGHLSLNLESFFNELEEARESFPDKKALLDDVYNFVVNRAEALGVEVKKNSISEKIKHKP